MLGITTLASLQLLVVYTERGKLNNHIHRLYVMQSSPLILEVSTNTENFPLSNSTLNLN